MASHDKILIVDFGSQVTQLIARRVREEKVYCEVVPYHKAAEAFAAMKPKAVILSGGPSSVLDKDAPLAPQELLQAGVPVLGICYGEQAMAYQLGGRSRAAIIVNSAVPRSWSSRTPRCSTACGRRARNTRCG
jgi:GMP synthase (glutamine-hydrolysing)